MIKKSAIYQKSAKGLEAIGTRQHGLAPRLRSVLILVDGKRGFDDIARVAGGAADAEQLLAQLLTDGFIQESSGAPVPAAAAPATAAQAKPALTLLEAQRFAVRRLTDILGPVAEDLCLRIEAAHNASELASAVAKAESIIKEFRGSETAAAFAAEMQSHRPG